jgi:hypothetical protein
MSVRLSALGLGVVVLLATAALTFAANQQISTTPRATPQLKAVPATLVVPDVRRQVYVFAKGLLVDAGFAWKVDGGVRGFSANTVASQSPLPGTRVLDNGAPTIVLTLQRNGKYGQKGTPEDASPYTGTRILLASVASVQALTPAVKPAVKKKAVVAKPAAAAKPKAKPAAVVAKPKPAAKSVQPRPPAFAVAGAPKEPLDEIPLTERAQRLSAWLVAHPKPTDANVKHWLYQNAWIVQGAKFGWWHGAAALRVLIAADSRAEAQWGIGAKSRAVAKAALAEAEASSS